MRLHVYTLLTVMTLLFIASCNGGSDTSPTAPTYPTGRPTGIQVETGSRSATISWNAVPGAEGYFVYISEDGAHFSRIVKQKILGTSFTVYDLTNGKTYFFGVSAVGAGGWESSIAYPGGSPMATPVVPNLPGPSQQPYVGVPPSAPKNLQGVAKDSACELEWDPTIVADFSHYRIYRTNILGNFELVQDNWTGLTFRNQDLANDIKVSYYITAVDKEDLESTASNTVTLTPRNFAPEALKNTMIYVNPARIILEWDIPAEADIAKYALNRVEGKDPTTGADILVRFEIAKPTRTFDNPHTYAGGFITAWVDIERQRIVIQDMAVAVGTKYTYKLAAIDTSNQEGPLITVVAPIPVF